jgi:adenylate kinase family enzyme
MRKLMDEFVANKSHSSVILVNGPSGTGKSYLGAKLEEEGIQVVHLDVYGYQEHDKWLLDAPAVVDALQKGSAKRLTVMVGTADNISELLPFCDEVMLIKPALPCYKAIQEAKLRESRTESFMKTIEFKNDLDAWRKHWADRAKWSPSTYNKYFKSKHRLWLKHNDDQGSPLDDEKIRIVDTICEDLKDDMPGWHPVPNGK